MGRRGERRPRSGAATSRAGPGHECVQWNVVLCGSGARGGSAGWPETVGERSPWPGWMSAGETLVQVGQWLRRLHDTMTDFVPPDDAVWFTGRAWRPNLVIGYHDAAPSKAVWRNGRLAGFVDWDTAGPSSAASDLAYTTLLWVPLLSPGSAWPHSSTAQGDRARRLHLLLDAYGWTATDGPSALPGRLGRGSTPSSSTVSPPAGIRPTRRCADRLMTWSARPARSRPGPRPSGSHRDGPDEQRRGDTSCADGASSRTRREPAGPRGSGSDVHDGPWPARSGTGRPSGSPSAQRASRGRAPDASDARTPHRSSEGQDAVGVDLRAAVSPDDASGHRSNRSTAVVALPVREPPRAAPTTSTPRRRPWPSTRSSARRTGCPRWCTEHPRAGAACG